MKITCGIIGLPNVGKSTLFQSLTNIIVNTGNFPFCTIQPNIASIKIPDDRLYQLNDIVQSRSVVHSTIEFIDFAGLIKGASKGNGFGDKILQYIRTIPILCHVVRCFDNDIVMHIENNINPCRDVNIVNTELILFDILQCEKNIALLKKENVSTKRDLDQTLIVLKKCLDYLYNEIPLRMISFSQLEIENIKKFNFLTFKPIIYVANITQKNIHNNIYVYELDALGKRNQVPVIKCDCSIKNDFKFNLISSLHTGYKEIINSIFLLLKLNTFFTVNRNMVRSWIFIDRITAVDAAYKVHSDFKIGFIGVQIIKYNDFIKNHGESGSKKSGRILYEGKNYYVADEDILKFLFHKPSSTKS